MSRRVAFALVMVASGGALVASALAAPGGESPRGGTLRVGSNIDIDSVDPGLGYSQSAWQIADASCARLFAYRVSPGGAGARVVPEVVRSLTVSPDRRTYTFRLKETFRFHTGARVTAQSFADAFNRNARAAFPSPAKQYMREIVGANSVIDGTAKTIAGVHVADRYRLQIRLAKRAEDFTARLTLPFFCPILPDTPADPRGIDNPAGSGPYYIAERIVNQRTVLRRNPYYRGERPANVDQMVWTVGDSLQECQHAVEDDRTDFCGQPGAPREAWRALADKYGVNRPNGQLYVRPSLGTWFYAFNQSRPAFRGPGQIPLKKAINFAIDRPALARTFGYLAGKRTDQMLPPALARAESIYPLGGANPAAARRWYAKARFKPTTLVLYTWNLPLTVAQAQIVAFNLKQIGIDLEVKFFDPDAVFLRARTRGEPFDIVIEAWGVDYADPWGFFGPLLAPEGPLAVALEDTSLRRHMEAANRLTGAARLRAFADLDVDLMRTDPPWVPVVHTQQRMLVSKSLGCFIPHPIISVEITALCKKR